MKRKRSGTQDTPVEVITNQAVVQNNDAAATPMFEDIELNDVPMAKCGLKICEDNILANVGSDIFISTDNHISTKVTFHI